MDSNEVARHAHGKRLTGARPESEHVASDIVEQEEPARNRASWVIVSWQACRRQILITRVREVHR